MARDYYDIQVQESSLGDLTDATQDDLDRYCFGEKGRTMDPHEATELHSIVAFGDDRENRPLSSGLREVADWIDHNGPIVPFAITIETYRDRQGNQRDYVRFIYAQ